MLSTHTSTTSRRSHRRGAFTLIEILVVVAIIGILMALVAFAAQLAIESANKASTKSMYRSWATALDEYRHKYGGYPNLGAGYNSSGDSTYLLDQTETVQNFVRALSGRNIDGSEMSEEQLKDFNRRRITFCSFPNSYYKDGDPEQKLLADYLQNTKIHIVLDTNDDGALEMQDQDLPEDTDDLKLQTGNKLNARIFIGTLKKDGGDKESYKDIYIYQ